MAYDTPMNSTNGLNKDMSQLSMIVFLQLNNKIQLRILMTKNDFIGFIQSFMN